MPSETPVVVVEAVDVGKNDVFVEMKTPTTAAAAADKAVTLQEDHQPVTGAATATATATVTATALTNDDGAKEPPKLATVRQLFSHANGFDLLLMVLGTIGAIACGVAQPIQFILIGDLLNSFKPSDALTVDKLVDDVNGVALKFVWVGLIMVATGFMQVTCWQISAARQAKRIRGVYVKAILTQEIGWFDVNEPMELSTKVADTTVVIQDGMGRKFGDAINFSSMAIGGIVVGLIKGWELALVLMAFIPFLSAAAFFMVKTVASASQSGVESYAKAGAIAEEALSNIRTVHMFNAIERFVTNYKQAMDETSGAGIKKGLAVGLGSGAMFFTMFATYAGGLYYGAVRVSNDMLSDPRCSGSHCYDGGKVVTVFFAIVMGALALGQAGPGMQAFFSARAAAFGVFELIDRVSKIDPSDEAGKKLETVSGRITLQNVTFAYPSRPDVSVCKNYSLDIRPGETVALVGASGSGKSTIVSLVERFYDPLQGQVLLDGEDLRGLNVHWLRQQIGLVGQEPTLFATSIMENIRTGKPDATDDEVMEAAKKANAFKFIMEFPKGFATEVGERGTQLSGGQKQRIAIARAIIKNPPILMLDEATSALDTESEHIVQESLDALVAESNRTTIIVAHRLTTVRDANRIAVIGDGHVVELGPHEELMKIPNGHYRLLVETQSHQAEQDKHQLSGGAVDDQPEARTGSRRVGQSQHSSKKLEVGSDIAGSEVSKTEVKEEVPKPPMSRIWSMTAPEWGYIVCGAIGTLFSAMVFPLWGVFMAKIVMLLFRYDYTKSHMLHSALLWAIAFLVLGAVYALSFTLSNYTFAVVSQRLTGRVRFLVFTAMLHQDIGWFDLDENTSGALIARLATDSAILQSLSSDLLNQSLLAGATLAVALAISFYYCWQMTLAELATMPVHVLSWAVQNQAVFGSDGKKTNEADTKAGALLSERIGAIRTVASYGMETEVTTKYRRLLSASAKTDNKSGILGGVAFSISQSFMFLNVAFISWIGGLLIKHENVKFDDMYVVMVVMLMSSFGLAVALQNAGDTTKAKKAAVNIFKIIDRVPRIDVASSSGEKLDHVQGDLALHHVDFAYPSRPTSQIYQNYSLEIPKGKTVALVGASGSGKSTAVSLIERFYDPLGGSITLDGKDLRALNLPWLRQQVSLVSQEPVLFAGTILENILLGKPDATRQEVIEAAKQANAHDFISEFPDGYDTDVGDRGAQVSGGQKQRIAIARAILRDPKVLILDEATSALDNESERIVQDSLDRLLALKQRTTVIVAHRLSTIRNADIIAVTLNGCIVEKGTHDELMQIPNGVYQQLVARQVSAST